MGRYMRPFFHSISRLLEDTAGGQDKAFTTWRGGLEQAFGALQLTTATIAQKAMKDPEEAGAAATDYLRMLGLVGVGYCFLKAASIAKARLSEGHQDAAFYEAKLATTAFFFDRILPQATVAFLVIKAGKRSTMALLVDAF